MQNTAPRPMRIALTIHALFGGGAERLMSQLAARWAAAGHEIHLITWASSETDQFAVPPEVRRHGLGLLASSPNRWRAILANFKRVKLLRRKIIEVQPELVLSFCDQMNIVTLQSTKRLAVPVIVSEHSNPAKQRLSRGWEVWRDRNYPRCDCCVVLTDEIAAYARRWVAADKIKVIPVAIAPPAANSSVLRSKSTVLAIGRLSHEKGFDVLIEAWRRVHLQLPEWQLCIAGVGVLEHRLAKQAHGIRSVKFLGWVQDTWSLYQSATIFVLSSRYEGFPVALVEALSQGLPAIATRCTEATQREPLSNALLLVSTESVDELADAIMTLARQPHLQTRLAESGLQASSRFHWNVIGELWDQLLLDQAKGGSPDCSRKR